MTQCQTILEAFQKAPNKTLTTAQLRGFYIANPNARVSQLKHQGHVIVGTKIGGKTTQWKFEYKGWKEPVNLPENPLPEPLRTWRMLPNGWEVMA
jgi:hypothetical protein